MRVARIGAPVFAAAISRYAPAIDGLDSGFFDDPAFVRRARQDLRTRLSGDRPAFALYVLQMVCDFWQHDGVPCNRMLPDASGNRRDQALLELVRGQLLMTRKLQPANRHLQRGFELAAPWLGTTGYFELLRRHELLACLRLADTPSPPQGLAALQAEAAVVRRLRGEPRCRSAGTHCDTLG